VKVPSRPQPVPPPKAKKPARPQSARIGKSSPAAGCSLDRLPCDKFALYPLWAVEAHRERSTLIPSGGEAGPRKPGHERTCRSVGLRQQPPRGLHRRRRNKRLRHWRGRRRNVGQLTGHDPCCCTPAAAPSHRVLSDPPPTPIRRDQPRPTQAHQDQRRPMLRVRIGPKRASVKPIEQNTGVRRRPLLG